MPSAPRQPADAAKQSVATTLNIDATLPAGVRHRMRWFYAVLAASLVVVVAALPAAQTGSITASVFWSLLGLAWIGFALAVFCRSLARRMVARAAEHDHLLCPGCTYDLRTLDDAGACPECGRAYEHEAVRAQWVDAQRRLKRR